MNSEVNTEYKKGSAMLADRRTVGRLFVYTERGLSALMRLNDSETALLSKTGQKGVHCAKLAYMNIMNELKKLETVNLLNDTLYRDRNADVLQWVNIRTFMRGLCSKINSVVGRFAELKVKLVSDIPKSVKVIGDGKLLQFMILNAVASIAVNIEKDKKIINISLNECDGKIQIKIWNKYAFRLGKKVVDESDLLELYEVNYDFEQMLAMCKAVADSMRGTADFAVEDDVAKLSILLSVCEDDTDTDMAEFTDESIGDTEIILPFAHFIMENMDMSDMNYGYAQIYEEFYGNFDKHLTKNE